MPTDPPSWPARYRVRTVARTGSTNTDLVAAARAGAAGPGDVLVALAQDAGRGRLGRSWLSPPGTGLTASVLLGGPASPWVPLLAGVALVRAVRSSSGLDAVLKWPNDVLVGTGKLAGLLAEVAAPVGVVVGVGWNLTTTAAELPGPAATSVRLAGGRELSWQEALAALLAELDRPATPADYRELCATLGRRVRVLLPGGREVQGTAEQVDRLGRLVVDGQAYSAGDIVHLR